MLRFYKTLCLLLAITVVVEGILLLRLTPQKPSAPQGAIAQPEARQTSLPSANQTRVPSGAVTQDGGANRTKSQPAGIRGEMGPLVFDRRTGEITDEFAKSCGLSNAEQSQLSALLAAAHQQYDSLLGPHAKITRAANGRIDIDIEPFIEDGAKVYDQLTAAFKDVLGQEKAGTLLASAGRELEHAFHQFGAATRSITISKLPQSDGSSRIMASEQSNFGEGMSSGSSSFSNYESFASSRYRGIVSILPDDVKKRLGGE